MDESEADADAKRYENALAKHVWHHEKALKIEPAQYGIRLSFALSAWVKLGELYPPALEKLRTIRDKDELGVREGEIPERLFHDLAAINEHLGQDTKTTQLFVWLDQNKPDFAKSVYSVAQPSLIRAKKINLCGKYLDPEASFKRMLELYNLHKNIAATSASKPRNLEFGRKRFGNDAAILVALLSLNNRSDEAAKIAAASEAELDDPKYKSVLARAKDGEVPEPWP
ncbi:MAG: hypothetical protein IT579_13155 [Verrucomicrobia subdivision 3 bacterium]|nr:hypothetical protein [Limisphaerales bacterium]